jgi:hypothetical protein
MASKYKLLEPSLKIVKDEVLSNESVCKKHSITTIPNDIVPFHEITLKIDNWTAQLVNFFRNYLTRHIKTKRLSKISIITDDNNIIKNHVETRLQFIRISRKAPTQTVGIEAIHKYKVPNPVFISTHDMKFVGSGDFKKYVDPLPIVNIAPNKSINISAHIEENSSIEVNHSCFEFLLNFDRSGIVETDGNKTFEEVSCIEFEYNKGEVIFSYQDDMSGKEVIDAFKAWSKEYIDKILSELDDFVVPIVNIVSLSIPADPAKIIANTILVYIYETLDRKYIIEDLKKETSSVLNIKNIDEKTAVKGIKDGLAKLKKHIDKL